MNLKYGHTTISASAVVTSIRTSLMGALVYSPTNVNGKVEFMNDADGTGTALLTLGVGGITNGFGGSTLYDFTKFGGREFADKMYCKITGSGVIVTIWHS